MKHRHGCRPALVRRRTPIQDRGTRCYLATWLRGGKSRLAADLAQAIFLRSCAGGGPHLKRQDQQLGVTAAAFTAPMGMHTPAGTGFSPTAAGRHASNKGSTDNAWRPRALRVSSGMGERCRIKPLAWHQTQRRYEFNSFSCRYSLDTKPKTLTNPVKSFKITSPHPEMCGGRGLTRLDSCHAPHTRQGSAAYLSTN